MQATLALRRFQVNSIGAALVVVLATTASGCTGAATQPGSPPPLATVAASPLAPAQVSQWLSFDAAAKTATLTMVADAQGVDNRYNFNGYSHGSLVITVPRGWMVTVHCNDDPLAAYAHSCAVVSGAESKTSAFSGAGLPDPTGSGYVSAGESKSFTFTPGAPFVGRFACLLIGHEAAGMWATFQVSNASQPSLGTRA